MSTRSGIASFLNLVYLVNTSTAWCYQQPAFDGHLNGPQGASTMSNNLLIEFFNPECAYLSLLSALGSSVLSA